jgi:hypothetical protein
MSRTIWFEGVLTCLHCNSVAGPKTDLQTSGLNQEPVDDHVAPGDILEITQNDFRGSFITIRDPANDPMIFALEQWGCPSCDWVQWARIEFEPIDARHFRYVSARTVAMTLAEVQSAHYLSRSVYSWVHGNPDEGARAILEAYRDQIRPERGS